MINNIKEVLVQQEGKIFLRMRKVIVKSKCYTLKFYGEYLSINKMRLTSLKKKLRTTQPESKVFREELISVILERIPSAIKFTILLFFSILLAQDFTGNTDRLTVVPHDLSPPITTRVIRFQVLTWYSWYAMRVELYGCHGNEFLLTFILHFSRILSLYLCFS